VPGAAGRANHRPGVRGRPPKASAARRAPPPSAIPELAVLASPRPRPVGRRVRKRATRVGASRAATLRGGVRARPRKTAVTRRRPAARPVSGVPRRAGTVPGTTKSAEHLLEPNGGHPLAEVTAVSPAPKTVIADAISRARRGISRD